MQRRRSRLRPPRPRCPTHSPSRRVSWCRCWCRPPPEGAPPRSFCWPLASCRPHAAFCAAWQCCNKPHRLTFTRDLSEIGSGSAYVVGRTTAVMLNHMMTMMLQLDSPHGNRPGQCCCICPQCARPIGPGLSTLRTPGGAAGEGGEGRGGQLHAHPAGGHSGHGHAGPPGARRLPALAAGPVLRRCPGAPPGCRGGGGLGFRA